MTRCRTCNGPLPCSPTHAVDNTGDADALWERAHPACKHRWVGLPGEYRCCACGEFMDAPPSSVTEPEGVAVADPFVAHVPGCPATGIVAPKDCGICGPAVGGAPPGICFRCGSLVAYDPRVEYGRLCWSCSMSAPHAPPADRKVPRW